jgi:hypothetical protein
VRGRCDTRRRAATDPRPHDRPREWTYLSLRPVSSGRSNRPRARRSSTRSRAWQVFAGGTLRAAPDPVLFIFVTPRPPVAMPAAGGRTPKPRPEETSLPLHLLRGAGFRATDSVVRCAKSREDGRAYGCAELESANRCGRAVGRYGDIDESPSSHDPAGPSPARVELSHGSVLPDAERKGEKPSEESPGVSPRPAGAQREAAPEPPRLLQLGGAGRRVPQSRLCFRSRPVARDC